MNKVCPGEYAGRYDARNFDNDYRECRSQSNLVEVLSPRLKFRWLDCVDVVIGEGEINLTRRLTLAVKKYTDQTYFSRVVNILFISSH